MATPAERAEVRRQLATILQDPKAQAAWVRSRQAAGKPVGRITDQDIDEVLVARGKRPGTDLAPLATPKVDAYQGLHPLPPTSLEEFKQRMNPAALWQGFMRPFITPEMVEKLPKFLEPTVSAFREFTSPAMIAGTVATAGAGPAVATGLRGAAAGLAGRSLAPRALGLGARGAAGLVAPIVEAPFAARVAAEAGVGTGATLAAQETAKRIPETWPTAAKVAAPLAAGLAGGLGTVAGIRGAAAAAPAARTALAKELVKVPSLPVQKAGLRVAGLRSVAGGAERLPLNPDGTVTLYHATTKEAAAQIERTGTLIGKEDGVFLSTDAKAIAESYGDGTVVRVKVRPDRLVLDDEFPTGRRDFRIPAKIGEIVPIGEPNIFLPPPKRRLTIAEQEAAKLEKVTPLPDTPLVEPPPPTGAAAAIPGTPRRSQAQADETVDLFSQWLASPLRGEEWEATLQSRAEILGHRFGEYDTRIRELLDEGSSVKEALEQASKETLPGELPPTSTRISLEFTESLYDKMYHVLKDEPMVLRQTHTALTNALRTGNVPRELGTAKGSAYTRLERVFGEELTKVLDSKQPIERTIEKALIGPMPKEKFGEEWMRWLEESRKVSTKPFEEPGMWNRPQGRLEGKSWIGEQPIAGERPLPLSESKMRLPPAQRAQALIDVALATYPDISKIPVAQRVGIFKTLRGYGLTEAEVGRLELKLFTEPERLAGVPKYSDVPYVEDVWREGVTPSGQGAFPEIQKLPLDRPFPSAEPIRLGKPVERAQALIDTVKATYPDITALPESQRNNLLREMDNMGLSDAEFGRFETELFPGPERVAAGVQYDLPIQKAIEQPSLMPATAQHYIIRALKESGRSAVDISNLLRANKSSIDFSVLRQLKMLMPGNPRETIRGLLEGWHGMWNDAAAKKAWENIKSDLLYDEYVRLQKPGAGRDFLIELEPAKGQALKGPEEFGYALGTDRPIPKFTAKIPWVKVSQRGFITAKNGVTWRIFKKVHQVLLRDQERIGQGLVTLKPGEALSISKNLDSFAKYLADMSGRGGLGRAAPLARELTFGIWAPRLLMGRILSPRHLMASNPYVRKQAWKDFVVAMGFYGSILFLGKELGLWNVEADPRSPDFAKLRLFGGKVRIDIWGGFQQLVRLVAQIATNTGIDTDTGQPYNMDPLQALTRFARSKAAPFPGMLAEFQTGKMYTGEEIDPTSIRQWTERIAPLAPWDIYEALTESNIRDAAIVAVPALVGEGISTYGTPDWKPDMKEYFTIPSDAIGRAQKIRDAKTAAERALYTQGREKYRTRNPEVDAKLFISGNVTSFKTDRAMRIAADLIRQNGINPQDINAIKDRLEQREEATKVGLSLARTTVDDLIRLLGTPQRPKEAVLKEAEESRQRYQQEALEYRQPVLEPR